MEERKEAPMAEITELQRSVIENYLDNNVRTGFGPKNVKDLVCETFSERDAEKILSDVFEVADLYDEEAQAIIEELIDLGSKDDFTSIF